MIKIEDHFNLVHAVIKKYLAHSTEEYEDMYQQGCLGLMKAAEDFDPTKGFSFSTYAYQCIRFTITTYLRRTTIVKIPRDMYSPNLVNISVCSISDPIALPDGTVVERGDFLGYEDEDLHIVNIRHALDNALQHAITMVPSKPSSKNIAVIKDYIEGLKQGIKVDQRKLASKHNVSQKHISCTIAKYMEIIRADLVQQGYGG